MERRKFVIGLGSLAAGGAAATGTGAFSAAQINGREADIQVDGDDDALIQLVPGNMYTDNEDLDGSVSSDRVYLDDGQLKIDFTGDEGTGVGPNSTYQVGAISSTNNLDDIEYGEEDDDGNKPSLDDDVLYTDSPSDDPAFVIRNGTDQDLENVVLGWTGDEVPDREDGVAAAQVAGATGAGSTALTMDLAPGEEHTSFSLDAGEEAYVSLIVSTLDIDPDDAGWQGSFMLNAGEGDNLGE